MKIKKYLWVLFFSLTAFSWAQTIEVSGTVIDGSNNLPLPGANVIVKNTTNGTQTDFDGNFSLQASPGDLLVVSFLGYLPQEVPVTDSPILVTLIEDSQTLDQVVVVGYGTQSKRDITGSVSIIDDEAFDDRPNTQVGALLQGKAPGVQVVSGSGKPSS